MAKPFVSSHQRTLTALRRANLATNIVSIREPSISFKPFDPLEKGIVARKFRVLLSTFSFRPFGNEDDPVLVPRLLASGEMTHLKKVLREVINLVAEGKDFPEDVNQRLKDVPNEQLAEAIREGISRWHTFKERE